MSKKFSMRTQKRKESPVLKQFLPHTFCVTAKKLRAGDPFLFYAPVEDFSNMEYVELV